MKTITQAEIETLKLQFKPRLNKCFEPNKFILAIQALKIGEMLMITKEEWPIKTPPVLRIGSDIRNKRSVLYGRKFHYRTLIQPEGWLIKRIN